MKDDVEWFGGNPETVEVARIVDAAGRYVDVQDGTTRNIVTGEFSLSPTYLLSTRGDFVGCEASEGRVRITEFEAAPPHINRLTLAFVRYCENSWMRGCVHFERTP